MFERKNEMMMPRMINVVVVVEWSQRRPKPHAMVHVVVLLERKTGQRIGEMFWDESIDADEDLSLMD
jgi:hypothetical protein